MNKIILKQDEIINSSCKDGIEIVTYPKNELFTVNIIELHIKKNMNILIEADQLDTKVKIKYYINPKVKAKILDLKKLNHLKIQEEYYLDEGSNLEITKIYEGSELKKNDVIYLSGKNSSINYILKTIANQRQIYNTTVYHKNINTSCNIIHHGITQEKGAISFHIMNIAQKGMKNTFINQENRIITQNNKLCEIRPDLIIDEQDIIANHSAYMGDVDERELFYLQSRGISSYDARKLLMKGFLYSKLDSKYESKIKKFISAEWR